MQLTDRYKLQDLINQIKMIQQNLENEDGYLLQFKWHKEEQTAYLEGNSAGLLNLCRQVLDLCLKDFEGAHAHFDEHSNLPEGSDSLIILKQNK